MAILFPDEPSGPRDIVIRQQGGYLQRINELNANYDPLQYTLMFPHGTQGYSWEQFRGDRSITLMKYYRYRLMIKRSVVDYNTSNGVIRSHQEINPIVCMNQLTHQFVVDIACKIISTRLRWYRLNQKELRAESYGTLITDINAGGDGSNVGRRIVLPATYHGSPRFMYEKQQDSMALVRRYIYLFNNNFWSLEFNVQFYYRFQKILILNVPSLSDVPF